MVCVGVCREGVLEGHTQELSEAEESQGRRIPNAPCNRPPLPNEVREAVNEREGRCGGVLPSREYRHRSH